MRSRCCGGGGSAGSRPAHFLLVRNLNTWERIVGAVGATFDTFGTRRNGAVTFGSHPRWPGPKGAPAPTGPEPVELVLEPADPVSDPDDPASDPEDPVPLELSDDPEEEPDDAVPDPDVDALVVWDEGTGVDVLTATGWAD